MYPIKPKVKEIGNDGQEIPANISNYLGDNIDGFSTLYDTVVLAVDEIEDLPGSARPPADKAAERKYPGKSSRIKVAELLELVKGNAEKYIPKQEIVRDIQINVQSMLGNLPQNATVHVQNENELAAVGATNNLRGLAANVKFISDGSITNQSAEVNQKHSRELETIEELKQQNELLKKQVDYWHSQTAVTVGARGIAEKFKRKALKPGKGDTQHAPQQLIGAVTEFCEVPLHFCFQNRLKSRGKA